MRKNLKNCRNMKVIISGGGTGGHIFPAIAIANEFRRRDANVEILFIGAKGRMEEERVPQAGYNIECLNITGFDRGALLKNVGLPFKIIKSLLTVRKIIKRFRPDAVIGVGGFASAPTLFMASKMGIPTFIQEQNAYPGVTNKIVGKNAKAIFTAYDNMERFFGVSKVVVTGNPIRRSVVDIDGKRAEALKLFGLRDDKRTLLVVGGSLGAKSINEAINEGLDKLIENNIQLIWQTGKGYDAADIVVKYADKGICVLPFIDKMDMAYAAADIIVSRAGAIAISELCCVGKPVIFVPFPYAAEDHQTKNAMFLVERGAGICIKNEDASRELVDHVLNLFSNEYEKSSLSANIKKLERKKSAEEIVEFIINSENLNTDDNIKSLNDGDKAVVSITQPPVKNIFFIGIGGIGMSALARYYKAMGKSVSGYDSTPSIITDALIKEGIAVNFVNDLYSIDENAELVIYTPAVKEYVGYDYYKSKGVKVIKRAEALAAITNLYKTIAVAGTHGKTTTSTMVAHIMKSADKSCNSFLGGISSNYDTNLLLSENANLAVTEADEFDRSFLRLNPSIAVITSVDADHLDIYGTGGALLDAFREYAFKAKDLLILKHGLVLNTEGVGCDILTYSMNGKEADCYVDNVKCEGRTTTYDIVYKGNVLKDVILLMPGLINVENSLAAFIAAKSVGVSDEEIRKALGTFKGVRRRFDFKIEREDFVYVDDYCHHPSEIKAFVNSMRAIYPDRKLTGVFQPHLYSRTRDFADGFAESLSLLDSVILLDIYPAREKPIEGVSATMLLDRITLSDKFLVNKVDLMDKIKELNPEVLMTMGAGDINLAVNSESLTMYKNSQSDSIKN